MPVSCCAIGCSNRFSPNSSFTFHRFPLNHEVRRKWESALRRKNWQPKHWERVCSQHFEDSCFLVTRRKRCLRDGAVPSIFDFPSHLKHKPPRPRLSRTSQRASTSARIHLEHQAQELEEHHVDRETQRNEPGKEHQVDQDASSEESSGDIPPKEDIEAHSVSDATTERMEETSSYSHGSYTNQLVIGSDSDHFSPSHEDASTQTALTLDDISFYESLSQETYKLKKTVSAERMKIYRLRNKVKGLKEMLDDLREQSLVSEEFVDQLFQIGGNDILSIVENELQNRKLNPQLQRYSDDIKKFSLTVYFHSPAAYRYLRTRMSLPHERTMTRWMTKTDDSPGFTDTSLQIIKSRVEKGEIEPECVLIIDSMSIRRQIIYSSHEGRNIGYVDIGIGDDDPRIAGEALVFLLNGLKTKWRYPIGYFFVDHVDGKDQAFLVTAGLKLLHEHDIYVRALVMDGSFSNQRTAQLLGASLDLEDFRSSFPHPSNPGDTVHIIFDPCHMVKLLRNLFGDYGVLTDSNGQKIRWEYLVRLNQIQHDEGIHIANRLRTTHIEYKNQKMNVRLAAQVMSQSVATALEYMRRTGDRRFSGSEATCVFLRRVDELFDRLNASNPHGLGLKAPIKLTNLEETRQILNDSIDYLSKLKTASGQLVIHSRRRTGVIGFMTAVKGVIAIAEDVLLRTNNRYIYFLPYKCSQDHVETFFAMIRRRGGWNNNPNVLQFRGAYRRLIGRDAVILQHVPTSNVIPLDEDEDDTSSALELNPPRPMAAFSKSVITYIAGFVVRKVRSTKCTICFDRLFSSYDAELEDNVPVLHNDDCYDLIEIRDRGGLIKPSKAVLLICQETEQFVSRLTDNELCSRSLLQRIRVAVLNEISIPFPDDHDSGLDSHAIQLTKSVIDTYVKVRLHHWSELKSESVLGRRIRSKLTKTILFSHQ